MTVKEKLILEFCVTSACNLGCRYCSEGRATFDKSRVLNSKIKISVDEALNFMDKYDIENIGFWGGEPFLNFDFCKKIMNARPDLKYFFYTNGMYVEKYLDDLIEIKNRVKELFVQVSYDGDTANDILRVGKNQKSVSEKIRNSFLILKENKIGTAIKATITPDTFKYMFESYKDITSISDSYFPTPDCFSKYDDSKWNIYYSDLKKSLIKIAHYIYENNLKLDTFRWFTNSRALCQCGDHYLCVDVDGYIFPCHSAMYTNLDHKIAHIRDIDVERKISEAFKKYSGLNEKTKCNCDVKYCMKCPIGAFQINSGSYEERYTTKNIDMCRVFHINDSVYTSLRSLYYKARKGGF